MFVDTDAVKLHIGHTGSGDEDSIEAIIKAVSKQIEVYCHRLFDYESYNKTVYIFETSGVLKDVYLDVTPIVTVSTIEVDGEDVTDNVPFSLNKRTGYLKFVDGWFDGEELVITYDGGYEDVPEDVKMACILQSAYLFQNRDTVGVIQAKTNDGDVKVSSSVGLLDGVKEMLDPYRVRLV